MITVKTTLAATFAAALALTASAQITPPFPSGINTFAAPSAANAASYAAGLGDLYFNSDANVPSVIQTWGNGPINLATVFGSNPWKPGGGSVKTIFIGETAGWTDDFGYTPSSSPSTHTALISDIRSNNVPTPGGNVMSGWETTVNYAAGTTLDFFINSGGDLTQGGLFYGLGTGNQFAGTDASNHIKWSTRNVVTTYFDGVTTVTAPVTTLLIGFEDTRTGVSFYDADFNDVVVGIQFLPTQVPVPEPSTYGLLGGVALLGLVGYRRFKRK
jgi:hypothetical protein